MVESSITIPNQKSIDTLRESIESLHCTVTKYGESSSEATLTMVGLTKQIKWLTVVLLLGLVVQIALQF